MAEIPICVHCRKPINKASDDYVVLNKDKTQYENQYLYAHVKCQEKHGKPDE